MGRIGLDGVRDERVDALPTGLCRMVELARALAVRPRLLLLDEPASGQDESETEQFAATLRSLAAEGMAVVLVEHDMRLVMDVCEVHPRARPRPGRGRGRPGRDPGPPARAGRLPGRGHGER